MLLPLDPHYLIDTCAIGDLEGISPATAYTTDEAVRARVWRGIERLARDGRMATVHAAKEEIKRRCPNVLPRLEALPAFFLPDTPAMFAEVLNVFAASPSWQRDIQRRKPNRDPADPYLVAMATLSGFVVVTTEKHHNDRTANNRRGDRVPDVCERRGAAWRYLADFVTDEGL